MRPRPEIEARVRERDRGLERQRRITRRVFVVAAGASVAFAGLAGVSKATQTTPTTAKIKAAAVTKDQAQVTETPTIDAPVTPVTPAYVPPVTSSGGS
jgi:hypothetical protein